MIGADRPPLRTESRGLSLAGWIKRLGFRDDFILQVFGILLWIENCDGGYDYGFDRILAVVSICLYCCYHSRMMKAGCYKLI